MRVVRRPFVFLAASALVAIAAFSQQDTPPPAAAPADDPGADSGQPSAGPEFFESIDVNVVNVDVYVTDKKGNRITGLTRDDFELFEDKKPVQITNFYAVEEGRSVTPAGESSGEEAEAAPELGGLPSDAEVPEDQRLHLVVYIDNFNLKVFDRNRVFAGLREFLRTQLTRGDRVMLMTYDRESHVRRPFTTDPTTIASALFEIEKMSAMGNSAEKDRADILREIDDAEDANYAILRVRSYAESVFNDLTFSLNAIKETVSSLAGLPGRKAVLYVSSGIPLVAAEDVFHAIQDKWSNATGAIMEARQYDATRRYQEILAQANANRITFYTIDAGGLRVSTSVSAENARPTASGFVDSVYFSNLQGSLQLMAERTGGKAIYNTNDPTKGLAQVADDFRNYYSLGYSPAHSGDGRYHDIQVKTKRKDLVVRHRDGYRDKTVEARMSDGVLSSLFFDVENNPLGVVIDRGRATARDDGNYLVPVEVRIPIGKLTLVAQGARHAGRLRLFVAAMDTRGGISEVQEVPIPIEIPTEQLEAARGQNYVYQAQLLMRKGAQKLAVGVRDELAAVSSFTVRTMNIGAG